MIKEKLFKTLEIETLAWIMWISLAISYSIVYFHRISLVVALDYLIIDLNIKDGAMVGLLTGMYAIIYMFMQIPSGYLSDFWGPRKTVTLGMLVACLGSVLFALAPVLSVALLARAIVGLGVSVVLVSVYKFQISWFKPSQFATLVGLNMLAGNLGGALGTTPMAYLVTGLGWRTTFLIVGLLTLLSAFLCWSLVRDTPSNLFQRQVQFQENYPKVQTFLENLREFYPAFRAVITNKHLWPPYAVIAGVYGTLIAFSGTWSVSYLMQIYGFGRGEAANLVMAVTIGMIFGCPFIGFLSDRMARRKVLILFFLGQYLTSWVLLYYWNGGNPPVYALYPIFFNIGFAGSTVVLAFTSAKELCSQDNYAGTAIGVINSAPFVGMAFLQPFMGFLLDLKWEGVIISGVRVYPLSAFRLIFASSIIIVLICLFLAFKIKESSGN